MPAEDRHYEFARNAGHRPALLSIQRREFLLHHVPPLVAGEFIEQFLVEYPRLLHVTRDHGDLGDLHRDIRQRHGIEPAEFFRGQQCGSACTAGNW